MAVELVGRDEELGSLYALLDRHAAVEGPIAIALEGEPGIGKSTLWRAVVEAARGRGERVLSSRPAESERALAYAGLGDLFDGVLGDVLAALTAPRRRALKVALLVEDEAGRPVDPRALGVAVRGALELLAEEKLVLAIDDLQWLDPSSASALGFALRRLPRANITLVWTHRIGEPKSSTIESALDPDRIDRVRIGPLSAGAIQEVIRRRLSRAVARPTLVKLHEVSAGNPFYALELARAIGSDGTMRDPTQPLPVPERLEELISARLGGFSDATHEALVLASADGRLTPAQLYRCGITSSALEPALDEEVIAVAQGAVRFTHPLLASVLYQGLSTDERQRAHRRLARLVDDPVARARHLALSTNMPDAELAAALEGAAAAATAHGAPIAAAELGEHALRLTPVENAADLDRRVAATARAHRSAGDVERARVLASELLDRASAGAERAEALALLAGLCDGPQAIRLLREALSEPGAPPALQSSIHRRLSGAVRMSEGLAAAEQHAQASLDLADRLDDPALRAAALGWLALIRFNAGEPGALRLAEQAYELASTLGDPETTVETGLALAHVQVWSVRLDEARALLNTLRRTWSERDELITAQALWYLAFVELRAGRLALADEHAEEARRLNALYVRDEAEFPTGPYPLALAAANRGQLERARELAEQLGRQAELHRMRLREPAAIRAVVELWGGDAQAAVAWFATAEQVDGTNDVAEPSMSWWRAEQAEALLEVGLVEDAVDRIDAWEADGRRLGRDWVLAHSMRCRGLVAASRGDVEQALSLLADAASEHQTVGDPLGRARALLALGVVKRRMRQKRGAREAISQAVAIFDECGAEGWAKKARSELGRIGGRRREEGLTPAEQRVAALVVEGRTNREVAAALFLGEGTVETHLSRIYAKLGVRSRTELARTLSSPSRPEQSSGVS